MAPQKRGSSSEIIHIDPSSVINGYVDSGSNQSIVATRLNQFNYFNWSRNIQLALGGRSKESYIKENKVPAADAENYEKELSKDQQVRAWILNSMDPGIAEVFNYHESAYDLWEALKELYGSVNNAARVFQLQRELFEIQQGTNSFVQHLGVLKSKWNEIDILRPYTTDGAILRKRADEDKVFQLLASLGPEYEDLRSHLMMSAEFPKLSTVTAVIHSEETRRKVMNVEVGSGSDARAFAARQPTENTRVYKGKRPDLFCTHCKTIGRAGIGHLKETCWILHPELKPKWNESQKGYVHKSAPKANLCSAFEPMVNFTSNPITLINEFANFINSKQGGMNSGESGNTTALLGKFAGFLENSNLAPKKDIPGIITAFSTALDISKNGDVWIVDSGASEHITNDSSNLLVFEKLKNPSHVSIANGNSVSVCGKGKLHIFSKNIESDVLFVPSFPFKLLSVGKTTRLLNCLAIFSSNDIIF